MKLLIAAKAAVATGGSRAAERRVQLTGQRQTGFPRHCVPGAEPYKLDSSVYHGTQQGQVRQAIREVLAGEYEGLVFSAALCAPSYGFLSRWR